MLVSPKFYGGREMKVLSLTLIFALIAGCAFADSEGLRNVNGINISVMEAGEGPAVILLHGKGYSKEYMSSLFDYYKGKYHVYSYDSRGHGKTDKPEAFTLEDNADDLAGLVASCGLRKPIVIGFSMGSYITLKAAEKYPELFSKIVLIGTRGQGDTYPPERISEAKDKNDAAIIGSLIGGHQEGNDSRACHYRRERQDQSSPRREEGCRRSTRRKISRHTKRRTCCVHEGGRIEGGLRAY